MSEDRLAQIEKENALLTARNTALEIELKLMKQQVDMLTRSIFGSKSEKGYPGQLELFAGGQKEPPGKPMPPEEAASHKRKRSARKPRKPRTPDDLPVEETIITPDEVLADPEAWRQIGEKHSDRIDYRPGKFFIRRITRKVYVSRINKEAAPLTAELPPVLLEGALAAPGLLGHILVSKYVDHLPLYRQQKIYLTRYGVEIPRQTLSRWIEQCALALQPIYNIMVERLLLSSIIQADETPISYLLPGNGKTKTGYFWTFGIPHGDVIYRWDTRREHNVISKTLGIHYQGTLQCDGYSAYQAYAAKNPYVTLSGCLAHVRRKFYEAGTEEPLRANWVIGLIRQLYKIESELRQARASPKLRKMRRQIEAAPILSRLQKILEKFSLSGRHLPKSQFGKALSYALGQWPKLEVYLENGHAEIDNNQMENAIRPSAVGKKNWIFVGAAGAGQKSAIIYTLTETCRRHGIEPYEYLVDVLTRLPTTTNWEVHRLTPSNWQEERQGKTLKRAS